MNEDKLISVITKIFNSPLITKTFPNIEKVEVRELEERLSHPGSLIIRLNIYLKERYPTHRVFFLEKINVLLMDLLKTIEIGGPYNYIYYKLIEPDDTE